MYIKDGVAYAGDPEPLLKVSGVRPLHDLTLWVRFNTGETKTVDISPLLAQPAFAPLRDKELFNAVYLEHGCPVWDNGNIDIAPEYLYDNGSIGDLAR